MPLSEARRSQLDAIVAKMEAEGQEPAMIQAVVDDFKARPQDEELHPRMLLPEPGQEEVLDTYRRLPGEMAREAVNYLPQFGALAGTALASPTGPGMVGGAALGGAAGEAARQLIQGGPETSTEAAGRIGVEALKQGAMIGAPAAAGGSRAISPILRFAGRPSVQGATVAGVEMARGRDPITAAGEGVAVAGLSRALRGAPAAEAPVAARELPGDIQAIIRQELARTAPAPKFPGVAPLKAAEERAIKAQVKHAVVRAEKEAVRGPVDLPARVAELEAQGMTKYQIANTLKKEHGMTLGEAQRTVAENVGRKAAPKPSGAAVSDESANASRMAQQREFLDSPADEQLAYIHRRAAELKGQGLSIGQIGDTLASETGLGKTRLQTIAKRLLGVK